MRAHCGKVNCIAADGERLKILGSAAAQLDFEGQSASTKVYVSPSMKKEFLVSRDTLKELRVIHKDFPHVLPEVWARSANTPSEEHNQFKPDSLNTLEAIVSAYSDVLSDTLVGKRVPLVGGKMKIHLKDGPIRPTKIWTAPAIPKHWQTVSDKMLEEFQTSKIIAPVHEPTEWCSRGFWVPKPNQPDALRLVTDFVNLNANVVRPVHPFPTAAHIMSNIEAGCKWFAAMDAVHGYFQVELDYESSLLTTFLLPQGRFRYLVAPMGLNASSDEWCRRSDEAIQGIPGCQKIVDDILIAAKTKEELFDRIKLVLEGCRKNGVTISRKKFRIGSEIKFAGFIVNEAGVKPNPEKIEGIKNFPRPTNVSELKSFLGMVGQLDMFIPDLNHVKQPLHDLTKKNIVWRWLDVHQSAFDKTKEILSADLLNHHFDETLPVELLTDASRLKGLGFALTQKEPNGKLRIISCGSRSVTPAETRYAVCELELLAIEWAINKKCSWWLRGCPKFKVITDHRPLLGTFSKEINDVLNTRLQKLRLKLQSYNMTVDWIEGKNHLIADALSRAPLFAPREEACEAEELACRSLRASVIEKLCETDTACVATCGTATTFVTDDCGTGLDKKLLDLIEKAKADKDYQRIVSAFKQGDHPEKLQQCHPAREYTSIWEDISLFDEHPLLVYEGHRIIVPKMCRKEVLEVLHRPHTGQAKTKQNVKSLYYWPGMYNDVKRVTEQCDQCREYLRSQSNEPLQQTVAERGFQMVSCDLFDALNQKFLLVADRYSGMVFVEKLSSETTLAVTKKLQDLFDRMSALPQSLRADGGPCFKSEEFKEWCESNSITPEKSSAHNPRSNGHAEANVEKAKNLLLKCGKYTPDFHARLRELNNCPFQGRYSPTQLLYGHRQRGELPALPGAYDDIDRDAADQERQRLRDKAKDHHDKRAHTLPPASVGMPVWIQDPSSKRWNISGVIKTITRNGRTYLLELDNGRQYWRNRKFVRLKSTSDKDKDP